MIDLIEIYKQENLKIHIEPQYIITSPLLYKMYKRLEYKSYYQFLTDLYTGKLDNEPETLEWFKKLDDKT